MLGPTAGREGCDIAARPVPPHPGMDQGVGAAPWWRHLQSKTQEARWALGLLLWGTVVAEPPHCHLSSCRIATNVARKLQEERGKGRLRCPRGVREALGSPVTPCCSTRLSPHGGDQWLSPSSLVGQGHLGLLAAAWDRIPGRGDTTPLPQPCVFSPCSALRGPG